MIFLTAVFVFDEPFSQVKLVAFGLIWAALVIYSASMLQRVRSWTGPAAIFRGKVGRGFSKIGSGPADLAAADKGRRAGGVGAEVAILRITRTARRRRPALPACRRPGRHPRPARPGRDACGADRRISVGLWRPPPVTRARVTAAGKWICAARDRGGGRGGQRGARPLRPTASPAGHQPVAKSLRSRDLGGRRRTRGGPGRRESLRHPAPCGQPAAFVMRKAQAVRIRSLIGALAGPVSKARSAPGFRGRLRGIDPGQVADAAEVEEGQRSVAPMWRASAKW
jgi:hypothetical protein